jgi:hypothetical protein
MVRRRVGDASVLAFDVSLFTHRPRPRICPTRLLHSTRNPLASPLFDVYPPSPFDAYPPSPFDAYPSFCDVYLPFDGRRECVSRRQVGVTW